MAHPHTDEALWRVHRRIYNKNKYATDPIFKQDVKDRAEKRYGWRLFGLAIFKKLSGCVDCGYNARHSALQFDHLPGHQKVSNIGALISKSDVRLLDELAKCEVVCANCHCIRTQTRRVAKKER